MTLINVIILIVNKFTINEIGGILDGVLNGADQGNIGDHRANEGGREGVTGTDGGGSGFELRSEAREIAEFIPRASAKPAQSLDEGLQSETPETGFGQESCVIDAHAQNDLRESRDFVGANLKDIAMGEAPSTEFVIIVGGAKVDIEDAGSVVELGDEFADRLSGFWFSLSERTEIDRGSVIGGVLNDLVHGDGVPGGRREELEFVFSRGMVIDRSETRFYTIDDDF